MREKKKIKEKEPLPGTIPQTPALPIPQQQLQQQNQQPTISDQQPGTSISLSFEQQLQLLTPEKLRQLLTPYQLRKLQNTQDHTDE